MFIQMPATLLHVPPVSSTNAAGAIDVSVTQLALAAALVLVAVAISRWQRLGLERNFLVGAFRAVVQLVAIGYVLVYVFAVNRWWLVLLTLVAMLVAATAAATRRTVSRPKIDRFTMSTISATAMFVSAGLVLMYVTQ